MKELTQEEAERCARANGMEPFKRPQPMFCPAKPCWVRKGINGELIDEPLPLHPYFWFPRLWDKLAATRGPEWNEMQFKRPNGALSIWSGTENEVFSDHPCLAFCSAIEALEAKCSDAR